MSLLISRLALVAHIATGNPLAPLNCKLNVFECWQQLTTFHQFSRIIRTGRTAIRNRSCDWISTLSCQTPSMRQTHQVAAKAEWLGTPFTWHEWPSRLNNQDTLNAIPFYLKWHTCFYRKGFVINYLIKFTAVNTDSHGRLIHFTYRVQTSIKSWFTTMSKWLE